MKLLKGIGALFVKLWHWIKETAWVQPLLIVGAIFAIIFSIPSFTEWVGSLSNTKSSAYYSRYQITLNKQNVSDDSEADKFIDSIYKNSYFNGIDDVEGAMSKVDTQTYGEKFFVIFVSKTCNECNEFQPALELLEKQWGKTFVDCFEGNDEKTAAPIKFHTIFADENSDIDDDDDNEFNEYTIFERFLFDHTDFFENATGRLEDQKLTPYTKNASVSSDKFDAFGQTTQDSLANFPVPSLLLVDYTREAFEAGKPGVSEILFGVPGNSEYEKASLLTDMWNHLDDNMSRSISNKFSSHYEK